VAATLTAAAMGVWRCQACAFTCRAAGGAVRCPRCGAPVGRRKVATLQRTSALLFAAVLLYVPANVLTVMTTTTLFKRQENTILGGVFYLWRTGTWPLAVVIFLFSIVVPAAKFAGLAFLVLTSARRSRWRPIGRTRLYRGIELVGRWSMLDVYAVTLMAALARTDAVASVDIGAGAIAFGAVVVLTMGATLAFDPRTIWDG
jgi:paraquat-inducible protein A